MSCHFTGRVHRNDTKLNFPNISFQYCNLTNTQTSIQLKKKKKKKSCWKCCCVGLFYLPCSPSAPDVTTTHDPLRHLDFDFALRCSLYNFHCSLNGVVYVTTMHRKSKLLHEVTSTKTNILFIYFYSVSKLLGSALWRETSHSVLGSIGFSFILWATAFISLC